MNRIDIDNVHEYTYNYIDSGFFASVYKLDDKRAFKKFFIRGKYEEACKELSNLHSNTFVFPKVLVYENDIFVGYIMDYINGVKLDSISEQENIHEYIKEVKRCEHDICALSMENYYIIDLKPDNIMYTDDKKLKFLDTDNYFKCNNKDLHRTNLASYSSSIVRPIMNLYNTNFNSSKLNHMKRLLIEGRIKPSSYLREVTCEIESETFSEVNTFKDAKEGLKLLLK